MKARALLVLIVLVASTLVVTVLPARVKAAGPTFSDISWTPKYPQAGDLINVSATIEDPTGVQQSSVTLLYCSIPGGLCRSYGMEKIGASRYYNNTLDVYALPAIQADVQIMALNNVPESNSSLYYYMQYALSINATISTDAFDVHPGGAFNISVNAHYWNNTSAPVEYSQVNITRFGSTQSWLGTTDANGNFTVQVTAPLAENVYKYNASVTNRTLKGYTDFVSVPVLIEPMADLEVRSSDIVYSPSQPTEGDNVTANITIHNIGTENETFTAVVTLDRGGSAVELKNSSMSLLKGTSTVIRVWWTASVGPQWLNVTLKADDESGEINKLNNHASVLIQGNGKVSNNENPPLLLYALVVIIVIVAISVVLIAVRRRRPKAPMQ